MSERGLVQSLKTRLVRHAKAQGLDPNLVLTRYALERFLYRLSRSPHVDRFLLKGALLLLLWLGETARPTRDADLLGFGDLTAEALERIIAEVCALPVDDDGLRFDASSIVVRRIRPEDAYGGQRVTLTALLGSARLKVQLDVGIGDAVVPEPVWVEYPSVLGQPPARLRAYRPETLIAEKVHAMVTLGAANSRLRDFFDVRELAAKQHFDGGSLARALAATFAARGTPVPTRLPLALTPEFTAVEGKAAQWKGFVRRLGGRDAPRDFDTVIDEVATFIGPVLLAVGRNESFTLRWPPSGPWTEAWGLKGAALRSAALHAPANATMRSVAPNLSPAHGPPPQPNPATLNGTTAATQILSP